jgi:adenine-specific DNA-methyltransferase
MFVIMCIAPQQRVPSDTGSIFVQISDENVHRVRALTDEVFGAENFVSMISFQTTSDFAQAGGLP